MLTPPSSLAIALASSLAISGATYGVFSYHNATSTGPIEPVPAVPSPYGGCDDCSDQARQIAWSFDHQIDQWSSDTYRAHRRGIWVWVGNNAYGLEVGTDDSVVPPGFGWEPSSQDRRLIYDAYRRWRGHVSLQAKDIHP